MLELKKDGLVFSFPEVHPKARLTISFQRTLRIPDDGRVYPLPPGLGRFPVRHVDDFEGRVSGRWIRHGGVMLPMYQSEAMWLNFTAEQVSDRGVAYPFAIKVATGKINAVTGEQWTGPLQHHPQDYLVAPMQPWLDGYCVGGSTIRQFVAMPLGAGYTAEEQINHSAEHGGLQIVVHPMRREIFERRFPKRRAARRSRMNAPGGAPAPAAARVQGALECEGAAKLDMGLAPGGQMRQKVYDDPYSVSDWSAHDRSRCFVHLTQAMLWRSITGHEPPMTPLTAKEYNAHGFPWFDEYAEGVTSSRPGSSVLRRLKSVFQMGQEKGEVPLPENTSVEPSKVVELRRGLGRDQIREGDF